MEWLIVALVVGALLPIVVAVVTIVLGLPKGGATNWGMALAFGKGIGLGVLLGLSASALVLALVLGVVWLRDR